MTGFINALPGALSQGMIWGIMAIGLYITYKILDISDLTVDGSFCTGAAVCVSMMSAGHNMYLALLCAVLAGVAAGLITGFFHTKCGIPAILAGILTQLGLYSVNLAIMDMKANLFLNADKSTLLVSSWHLSDVLKGNLPFYRHPLISLGFITLVIIGLLYWFFGTELGSSLRATGANAHMARAQGINTGRCKVLGLGLSNGLVALAGALMCQYNSAADINMGRGAIVTGLAAIVIGGSLFQKIFHNLGLKLLSVSIGAMLYQAVIQAVISFFNINTNYMKLLSALIVALFLAVPYWQKNIRKGGKVC